MASSNKGNPSGVPKEESHLLKSKHFGAQAPAQNPKQVRKPQPDGLVKAATGMNKRFGC